MGVKYGKKADGNRPITVEGLPACSKNFLFMCGNMEINTICISFREIRVRYGIYFLSSIFRHIFHERVARVKYDGKENEKHKYHIE